MRKRTKPTVKRTYYLPPDRAEAFLQFCEENPSEALPYAMLAWMALSGQARDDIRRETKDLPIAEAIRAARKIIEESAIDQWRLKYMRSLPPKKQLELFEQTKGRK